MTEISPQFHAVLVSLANTPTNPIALAATLDISITTARKHMKHGLLEGYIEVINDTHWLTETGKSLIIKANIVQQRKQTNLFCAAVKCREPTTSYVEYKPAPPCWVRPGSMDAYRLPSRTLAGRRYPNAAHA